MLGERRRWAVAGTAVAALAVPGGWALADGSVLRCDWIWWCYYALAVL